MASQLWTGRELIRFFAWRDLRVRYKQAVLGVAWIVLQPVAAVATFTFVFHRLAGVDESTAPYPLFAMAGLISWVYFSSVITQGSQVLVGNAALVTKVYFPRLTAPAASLLPPLADLGVSLGLVAVLCVLYGHSPTWALLAFPLWLLLLAGTALGVVLWLSALNVRYRDVGHAITPALQVWLFLSPVAYPSTLVSDRGRMLYALNPMVGAIDVGRWVLIGSPWPGWPVAVSAGVAVVVLFLAARYFQRAERSFADVV